MCSEKLRIERRKEMERDMRKDNMKGAMRKTKLDRDGERCVGLNRLFNGFEHQMVIKFHKILEYLIEDVEYLHCSSFTRTLFLACRLMCLLCCGGAETCRRRSPWACTSARPS